MCANPDPCPHLRAWLAGCHQIKLDAPRSRWLTLYVSKMVPRWRALQKALNGTRMLQNPPIRWRTSMQTCKAEKLLSAELPVGTPAALSNRWRRLVASPSRPGQGPEATTQPASPCQTAAQAALHNAAGLHKSAGLQGMGRTPMATNPGGHPNGGGPPAPFGTARKRGAEVVPPSAAQNGGGAGHGGGDRCRHGLSKAKPALERRVSTGARGRSPAFQRDAGRPAREVPRGAPERRRARPPR